MADSDTAAGVRIVGVAPVTGMWRVATRARSGGGLYVESFQVAALVTVEREKNGLARPDVVPLMAKDLSSGKVMDALLEPRRTRSTDDAGYYDDIDAVWDRVKMIAYREAANRDSKAGHRHTFNGFEGGSEPPIYGPSALVGHYPNSCPKCKDEAK